MKRREFLKSTLACLGASAIPGIVTAKKSLGSQNLVVLGFDGVDPWLVERWIASGDLPVLSSLRKTGDLLPLASVSPPNSPVAWSSFATGQPPSEHGIFGFIKRDPRTYLPGTSPYTISGPSFEGGGVRKPTAEAHRRGAAFWDALDQSGIPLCLLFVPYAYPPPRLRHGRVVSGLGTPDLRFTNSTFTFYTSGGSKSDRVAGGRIVQLNPQGSRIETFLEGPRGPGKDYLRVPVLLELDRKRATVRVSTGSRKETLRAGKRSGWFPVKFQAQGLTLPGRVRFHLLSLKPDLSLYASPIQFDPAQPALPLGGPAGWLEKAVGIHGGLPTVGWVHDTSAVNAGVLPSEVFLADLLDTMQGRAELLLREIESGSSRLIVSVFTGTDRAAHLFYRDLKRKDGGPIRKVYRQMDKIVGMVQKRMRPGTRLLIISDHGFHAFDRMLHVNTWLESKGLLSRAKPEGKVQFLRGIDWSKTKAYSLGNGQVYVNLLGREKSGWVMSGLHRKTVLDEIERGLKALTDPHNQQRPVRAVYPVFDGAHAAVRDRAPDLQIAFAPGYRSSWETSLGGAPPGEYLAPNPKAWCGDHAASDVAETPGIIAANCGLGYKDPTLYDLATTLLQWFKVDASGPGRNLLG